MWPYWCQKGSKRSAIAKFLLWIRGTSFIRVFQLIYKLKIDTLSHALAIQSFDNASPKFFCKAREHQVAKSNESLFNNILTFEDWVEPSFGHRHCFEDDLDNAELTIESAIYEDRTLTNARRALVTVALLTTVQFAKALVQHVDTIYNQLTYSKHSKIKA